MAVTLKLGSLNLNDGSTYTLLPGLDLGALEPEVDVWVGLDGALALGPARPALVEVTVPLLVRAAGAEALRLAVEAVRDAVRACTYATPGTLTYSDDGTTTLTYTIVDSPEPAVVRDERWYFGLAAQLEVRLRRLP